MHQPPEVQFLVDGSPLQRRVLLVVGMLTVLQVAWFGMCSRPPTLQTWAVVVSALLAIGGGWFWTLPTDTGKLHWDGLQWQWSGDSKGAWTLRRHLDLQSLMLVSLQRRGNSPVWLWLQGSLDPHQWQALRRAVAYSTSPERAYSVNGTKHVHHTAVP